MDLSTVFLVIAGLVGLGMILSSAFVIYSLKEFNKSREKSRKEFDERQKEFDERWRKASERRR